ncbi:SDR family oxidoreductase [uncultured Roseibium sp.]|uniref:SDR family NAD(P)-dependent oxidoreductase n=1 Tax=uncultured Roseibium sp. TaxID=1936171 RepID=UPI00321798AC
MTRRALVSGGAHGIGAAVARALSEVGDHVTIADRDPLGEALAAEIGGDFVAVDAADAEDVVAAVSGEFDILVNNVGADQHAFFTDTGPEDWRRLLSINLESAFAFTAAVLPRMQARSNGRIVCIGSEAGRLGSKGGAVYAAAKAGLVGFTRSIARENARYGITCNAVLPGPIETPMVARAIAAHGERLRDAMSGLTLMKRLGTPQEVAAAVAFLCSDEASFITGEVLGVSGGMGCGGS